MGFVLASHAVEELASAEVDGGGDTEGRLHCFSGGGGGDGGGDGDGDGDV